MSKTAFIFQASIFATTLIMLASLGMPLVSTNVSPDNVATDTSVCDNIGGFDAVGDVLSCIADKLGILDYLDIKSPNKFISIMFTPLAVAVSAVVVFVIRGI